MEHIVKLSPIHTLRLGRRIIFNVFDDGCLYALDLDSCKIELINNLSDSDDPLTHSGVAMIKDEFIAAPEKENDILIFNKEFGIKDKIKLDRTKYKVGSTDSLFYTVITYGNTAYFFGFSYPGILCLNIDTGELHTIDDWIETGRNYNEEDGFFHISYYQNASIILLPFMNTNAVLEFHLDTMETKVHTVGDDDQRYISIEKIGDYFYLVPRDASTGSIVCWNLNTEEYTQYNEYPQNFSNIKKAFFRSCVFGDRLILLSHCSNMNICFDPETKQMSRFRDLYDASEIRAAKYAAMEKIDDDILFLTPNGLVIWNTRNDIVTQKPYHFSNEIIERFKQREEKRELEIKARQHEAEEKKRQVIAKREKKRHLLELKKKYEISRKVRPITEDNEHRLSEYMEYVGNLHHIVGILYSFDVFDTLITRKTATPAGIFYIMQENLQKDDYSQLPDDLRRNFADIRRGAEAMARSIFQRDGVEDITFEQIYEVLRQTNGLTEDDVKQLMELELAVELDNIIGVPAGITRARNFFKGGERVVLISDMYLSGDQIRKLLIKVDPIFSNIPIYVSSEEKKSKGGGNLFWRVKEREKKPFDRWFHYGDNPNADRMVPLRLGMDAGYLPFEKLSSAELGYQNECENYASQRLIGTARNIRLTKGYSSSGKIGASYTAPILYGYIRWILHGCIRQRIKRVYFIARDGFLLKEIADIIISKEDMPIQTYYIYGSRRAWRLPAISKQFWHPDKILDYSYYNSIKDISEIADIFELSEEEFKSIVSLEENIDLRRIRRAIETDAFRDYIIAKQKDKRSLAEGYLKGVINYKDENFAFVDMMGSGFSQLCLSELMSDFYQGEIKSFFFHMTSYETSDKSKCFCYYPGRIKWHRTLEALCVAPHGQTIAYQKQKGKIVPVLEDTEKDALEECGITEYIEGIKSFVEEYTEIDGFTDNNNYRELTRIYMEEIVNTEDEELKTFIDSIPFNVTGREHKVTRYGELSDRLATNHFYQVPFDRVGNKVALFAAGNVGKEYYRQLKEKGTMPVIWVDGRFEDLKKQGLPIENPIRLQEVKFDTILIAVESEKIAESIRKDLMTMGIDDEKIVY